MDTFKHVEDFVEPLKKEWLNPETNTKICYIEYGQPKGKTILLFHGIFATGLEKATLPATSELHVIMPYRPNYADTGSQVLDSISAFKNWLAPLIAHLKLDQFIVLGVSGGAPYAYATAYYFADKTAKLYICGGVPSFEVIQQSYSKSRKLFLSLFNLPQIFSASVMKLLLINNKQFYPELSAMIDEVKRYNRPWNFNVAEIDVNTAIYHGEKDQDIPFQAALAQAQQLKHATIFAFVNEGHCTAKIMTTLYTHLQQDAQVLLGQH